MNFFVSGYGDGSQATLKLYHNETILWQDHIPNPSYLCQTDSLLFAAEENSDHCVVTSYAKTTAGYRKISILHLEGKQLCHLSINEKQQFLVGSCWGSGTFFTISYKSDGTFRKYFVYKTQQDTKKEVSRFHSSLFYKEWLFTANVGLNQIICYRIENGVCQEYSHFSLPHCKGPRHLLLHPYNQLLYCITEDSSRLLVIDIKNPRFMNLLFCAELTSSCFTGKCYGSSITVTRNFSDLYAANRGENTIIHFRLDKTGIPLFTQHFSCHGDWPRHIALLELDSYLAIANQKSNHAVFLQRDPDSGVLSDTPVKIFFHPEINFITEQL